MKKTAVILLNIGGPDKSCDVRKYLLNFFSDKNIIMLPNPFRKMLAILISTTRFKESAKNYSQINKNGGSPLLENTNMQKECLQRALGENFKVFVCMRYWHPLTSDVVKDVLKYQPDEVILLPLYPQYSFATTRSGFEEWDKHFASTIPVKKIEEYCSHELFIKSWCNKIQESLIGFDKNNVTILFSAHGIPANYVKKGDPYKTHIEKSVTQIMQHFEGYSHSLCYQSRVGKLEWLKPYFIDEIKKYSGKNVVIVPISFVSEHVETLFELDIEYREEAEHFGVKKYVVCKTPSVDNDFINCLADLVLKKTIS